ncbi:MAG TPA: adenylosuccinate lyase [Vicinamibacterales bacterium]|jgi:adenylosuccinate lyase|nr:adenylosuccinate lyase [Vicinamibacterales bacterium]
MIQRYTHPDMGAIWSDRRRYETWLDVELAALDAMADAGIVPAEAARDVRAKAGFDIHRIEEIEQTTQHDVIAFTTAVAERVGPAARWLHFGLTSSDVIDTAQAIQMREACALIIKDVAALMEAVRERAGEHRRTPMIGRTHGVHAEPMTFGLKLALWYAELQRDLDRLLRAKDVVSYGKLSGAVGTFAHLDPEIEARVCRALGLQPAPVSSQVIQRDRHAELLSTLAITAASLEKFALEIRGLQKTEIGEVEEPFGKGQKGSSAMPHKRNPIGCEQIVGLARLIRANAMAALENVALWHERDISHSSVERVILPDSFIALDHMLRRFTRIVKGMVVYPDRMLENLQRSRGVVFSGTVLLELAKRGVSREQAYEWVQRNAMRSFHEQKDFKSLLLADADVLKVLGPAAIEKAFDLHDQLRNVDAVFARVFAGAAVTV